MPIRLEDSSLEWSRIRLPDAFCWTKYGDEAGEAVSWILGRKEKERLANDGVFLWGIGTSIRPSLIALLAREPNAEVIFSPMLSPPAQKDVAPEVVVAWGGAIGLSGEPFTLPEDSRITSRLSKGVRVLRHYALVCHSADPLLGEQNHHDQDWIDDAELRNLGTGRRLGSSQVTSVVTRAETGADWRRRYRIAFRATLHPPYLLRLSDHTVVGGRSHGVSERVLGDPRQELGQ